MTASFLPGFIHAYGTKLWVEEGRTHGSCAVRPDMLVPGTDRIRIGHLASLVDIVGGSPPHGPLLPTLDLRVQLLGPPPTAGELQLVNEPLKSSQRFFVAEVPIRADGASRPFASSTITFMNDRVPGVPEVGTAPPLTDGAGLSFHDMLAVRYPDACSAEISWEPRIGNGPHGTVLGAVQSLLAELAAEHALAPRGRHVVTDLDMRFLNRVKVGPVRARAEVLEVDAGHASLRVELADEGSPGRRVAFAYALCRPLAEAGGPGHAAAPT